MNQVSDYVIAFWPLVVNKPIYVLTLFSLWIRLFQVYINSSSLASESSAEHENALLKKEDVLQQDRKVGMGCFSFFVKRICKVFNMENLKHNIKDLKNLRFLSFVLYKLWGVGSVMNQVADQFK